MVYDFTEFPPEDFNFNRTVTDIKGNLANFFVKDGVPFPEVMGNVEISGIEFAFRSSVDSEEYLIEPEFSGDIFNHTFHHVSLSGNVDEVSERLLEAGIENSKRDGILIRMYEGSCSIFFFEDEARSIGWTRPDIVKAWKDGKLGI